MVALSTKLMTAAIMLLHLFLVFSVAAVITISVTKHDTIRCIEREGLALLEFKQNLVDDYGLLSTWKSHNGRVTDCCKWDRVYCNNVTHHVTRLELGAPCIYDDYNKNYNCKSMIGKVSSSLLELEHLVHLDLSGNDFGGMTIPSFIGSLNKLRYLNLAISRFGGEVPYQLKNLSSLQHVDLNSNYDLSTKDPMAWLSSLSSLRYLNLSLIDLSHATGWANAIINLHSLTYLNLSNSSLVNEKPSSLVHTNLSKSLTYVDLSQNFLSSSAIYPWLLNFSSSLVEVHLSNNQIEGPLPDAFGTMSSLTHLDLSINQLQGTIPYSISNLSHLLHLFLSDNQFDNWSPNCFQPLCRLQELDLSSNSLTQDLPSLFKSLSGCLEKSLAYLRLEYNTLTGSLPDFTKFSSLKELHLYSNKLRGTFPSTFQHISPLSLLDLQDNQLTGSVPDLSLVFPSLEFLYLQSNSLDGTISEGIGKLSMLKYLDLSLNSLHCKVTEAHLSNLSSLTTLDLSINSIVFDISFNWTPPFQLKSLLLTNCEVGPKFPIWLRNWGSLSVLDISYTNISDSIPIWFWNLFSRATRLSLSHNKIHGMLPNSTVQFQRSPKIDLSHNLLEGPIPSVFRTTVGLNLSQNNLSGQFAPFLCEIFGFIDLSDNLISGELPNCWKKDNLIYFLTLSNNNFSGKIPTSLGFLPNLKVLQLRNNRFYGNLPTSLKRCTSLIHVDITNNFISGEVPPWIGNSLTTLRILSLRNNLFTGIIPPQLCNLSSLQILDLSSNTISGTIPNCLSKLSAMESTQISDGISIPISYEVQQDFASVIWKGAESEYKNTLGLVKIIDLSSNELQGEIPSDLSNLTGLISLNLSRNQLQGPLSAKLGRLKSLEILDLSRNKLSGKIPASFSDMSSLSILDLSYNNLYGRIPSGTQLQSFNATSYVGNNPGLCGPPLPLPCPEVDKPTKDSPGEEGDQKDSFISTGLYVSVGLGFATGFWGVCGTLIFNRTLRNAYFRFLAYIYDSISSIVKFQG